MVAFKFNLNTETTVFQQPKDLLREAGGTAQLNVFVKAGAGFHIFVIATLGSLCVGHAMTASNRYALELGEYSQAAVPEAYSQRKRLCNTLRPSGYWSGKVFVWGPILTMLL